MKILASHRLHVLESVIQSTLEQRQDLASPVATWCVAKQHVLFIVLDYVSLGDIDREACLEVYLPIIQRSLHWFSRHHAADLLKVQVNGHVRCCIRPLGQPTDQPVKPPSVKPPSVKPPSINSLPIKQQQRLSHYSFQWQQSFSRLQEPGTQSDRSPNVPKLIKPKLGGNGPFRKILVRKRWPWRIAISAALLLATISSGSYAWTRPCVSDDCPILETAQAMPPSFSLAADASFEDVSQMYTTVLDVYYKLGLIPFWSPYYDQVKNVLVTYEEHADIFSQVLKAQKQAKQAAIASQSPPHPLEVWQALQQEWQQVIQSLETVANEDSVSPLVQTKLAEYKANLAAVEQQIEHESTARTHVQAARKAAQRAETHDSQAYSLDDWRSVESGWQDALARLNAVPTQTMAHAEAEHLRAIYQPQLDTVRDRLQSETLAEQTYNQAMASAAKSITFEKEQQWSLAVTHWQEALNYINQVPEESLYSDQSLPLMVTYTAALENAQQHLQNTTATQQAQATLEQRCAEYSEVCDFVKQYSQVTGSDLQVWLTADHGHLVERAIHSQELKSSLDIPAPILKHANDLVITIATVGQNMDVEIELYNADGILLGTYKPETSSYVQASSQSNQIKGRAYQG